MPNAANYTERQQLRDGIYIEIRALMPEDEAAMLAAIARTGVQSLQRRFFGMKREFSEKERNFFMKVDFRSHVALVAVAQEGGKPTIVGGGRYIVIEPQRAEMAFVVGDAGLNELIAEVLPENRAMLKVFGKHGFKPVPRHDPQTVHLVLKLICG